ncbi:hypothetical protein [Nocardioides sp. zg-1228]|uniref:DUF7657 domain-containing protein n=1 Tax=Nocardioides sp. zg-1228 TaxID=2763008 RepID=UPI001642BF5E|nr:hypothetical protein [Nocardioides sp. zg-1228]MBC2933228.1 hypothetical protein [Nocardioides sp. zg-1228]QSF56603.1 hypothetical protein JX575_13320 [Nocardioides sp. zg-1228]
MGRPVIDTTSPERTVPEGEPAAGESTSEEPASEHAPVWRSWRIFGGWADRLEVLLPLLAYAVVVLGSLSTSSLGLLSVDGSGDGAEQWGTSLPIRSDEWLTQAPIDLSVLAHGSSQAPSLSQDPDLIYQISSGQWVESVLFHEGNLLRLGPVLPDEMLFAAFRAWPWLLLVLALPPLLRRMGASRPMSWLGLVLVFLAPASLWWSFMPVRIMAFAAAGSYVLWLARDRMVAGKRVTALLQAGLAGILLARLVTYYVPWSLTLGVPLVIATGVYLVMDRVTRRQALLTIGAGAAVSLLVLAGTLIENAAALSAELNTVYPGLRRVTGAAQSPVQLVGGPALFEMEDGAAPTLLNQSEISSGFLVCGLWAIVIWRRAWAEATRAQRGAIVTLAAATGLWSAWALFDWGSLGEHIPLLSSVLPVRAAQTVGFPATLLLVLLASRLKGDTTRLAVAAAATVGVVTAYGASDARRALPDLATWQVWLAVLAVSAVAYAVTRWPARTWPVVGTLVLCLAAGADTNPLVHGVGELRTSPAAAAARALADRAEADGSLIATNSMATNALLIANGAPTLTGNQVTGPRVSEWEKIDPDHEYEDVWNRGASYLYVAFDGERGAPWVEEAAPDVIVVHVHPCWLAESDLDVGYVVSTLEITARCAKPLRTFTWYGGTQYVYQLRDRG